MQKFIVKKYFYSILLALFFSAAAVGAQQFNATVDRTTVGQYDRFQVYFTFEGGDINSLSNFRAPAFAGFKILSGPNQSSSMQIINGKVSGSMAFTYILQPAAVGDFTIGSASVTHAGKNYSTQPIKIKVEKGTPQQQKESNGGYSKEELGKNVFIVAEANKSRALLGEQILVTYKLYTKLNIASPQISKLPSYDGFWAEEVGPLQNINFEIGMYKGERFRIAKIKQVALFPSRTGVLSVTPFELNVPVIVKKKKTGNDVFDEFFNDSFFGKTETVEFGTKSNTIKVEVDPLPAGAPKSFNGAVGDFNFKAEVDKKDVSANESITLRLSINGSGNLKLLKVPDPELPSGFEKYEPKTVENINRGAVISGQKIIDYLIVPRNAGQKEIPPVEFTYFNPSSRKYITLKSQPFKINVRQSIAGNESASPGFAREDVKLLSEDIRFIKTSDFNLETKQEISIIKPWFWIAVFLPLLGVLGAVIFKRRNDKLSGNLQLMRYQKAEKAARKKLALAKTALDKNNTAEFYSELSLALFGYLEDKLAIQKSEFTLEIAVEKLQAKNVDGDLIERLKRIAEKCEYARFAPEGETSAVAPEFYDESVKVIIELDSSLDSRRKK